MADKLRRQKEITKDLTEVYNQTIDDYAKYINGSGGIPIYVTWYQIASGASTQDWSLENVHSFTGNNTPLKYKKIYDVAIYSTDTLEPNTELTDRGLESMISGDFVLLPNSVIPNVGDFFVFDTEGMEDHLFRIIDVQYDKATSNKFYKCTFELWKENVNEAGLDEKLEDEYVVSYNDSGTSNGVVVKASAQIASKTQNLIDSLIEKYEVLFYDNEMDTFSCVNNNKAVGDNRFYYYSPYLQHFIHKNQIVKKYNEEFMTEIYITDINEYNFPDIYDELAYRKSIFYAMETQDTDLPIESTFMSVSGYDLARPLNLPFFTAEYTYKMLDIYAESKSFYLNAFHFILADPSKTCFDAAPQYKFVDMEDLEDMINNPNIAITIKPENLLYQVEKKEDFIPKDILWISKTGSIVNASIKDMLSTSADLTEFGTDVLFEVIYSYLNDSLTIDEILLERINSCYTSRTIRDYILIPLVIYALKQSISSK